MFVGDLVMGIREAITDMPPVLPAPNIASATAATIAGGSIPPGTYYLVATAVNPWGETSISNEVSVVVGGGQNAIILSVGFLFATSAINIYLGGAAGAENAYIQFMNIGPLVPFNVLSFTPLIAVPPPTRNSAYIPDASGDSFNAASVFRWINDGLKVASQICGGLIDYAGVSTVAGNPSYVVPGQWKTISDVWYDGYPLAPDKVGNYFRRNSITASVLSSVATSIFDNRMALEVWPQPARTAGSTTLAAPLSATASSLSAASLAQFLLTNGMAQIDNEIVAYAGMTSATLPNLIRGLGGSTAAAHASGAPVTELNLFFHGWRMYAPNFQPSQASLIIPIPVGWDALLVNYGLGCAKRAEQNMGDWQALYKMFKEEMGQWYRTNRITTGPKQVGEQSNTLEVIPGSTGISWVVP